MINNSNNSKNKSKKTKIKTIRRRGKKWVFTWFATTKSSFIESVSNNGKNLTLLQKFFNRYCEQDIICQLEKGKKECKLHIQGRFQLRGERVYKNILLDYFKKCGIHSDGLYLDIERDVDKSKYYVQKSETRILGPFTSDDFRIYLGKDILYIDTTPTLWQRMAFILLKQEIIRKIIYIYSTGGDAGKTTWVKYCRERSAKLGIKSAYFSLSDVSRVLAGFCKLEQDPCTVFFDVPKSLGKNQCYQDLFSAVEQIRNGMAETNYYSNHLEKRIPPPNVFMTSNVSPERFLNFIASDRWQVYEVFKKGDDRIYKHKIFYKDKYTVGHIRDSIVTIKDNKIIYTKIKEQEL